MNGSFKTLPFSSSHLLNYKRFCKFLFFFKKKINVKNPAVFYVDSPATHEIFKNFERLQQLSSSNKQKIFVCSSWIGGQLTNFRIFKKKFENAERPSILFVFSTSLFSFEIANEGRRLKIPVITINDNRGTYSILFPGKAPIQLNQFLFWSCFQILTN